MPFSRRNFLQTITAVAATTAFRPPVSVIKPLRLKPGDTVARVEAEMDADAGTIRLPEPAVK